MRTWRLALECRVDSKKKAMYIRKNVTTIGYSLVAILPCTTTLCEATATYIFQGCLRSCAAPENELAARDKPRKNRLFVAVLSSPCGSVTTKR